MYILFAFFQGGGGGGGLLYLLHSITISQMYILFAFVCLCVCVGGGGCILTVNLPDHDFSSIFNLFLYPLHRITKFLLVCIPKLESL